MLLSTFLTFLLVLTTSANAEQKKECGRGAHGDWCGFWSEEECISKKMYEYDETKEVWKAVFYCLKGVAWIRNPAGGPYLRVVGNAECEQGIMSATTVTEAGEIGKIDNIIVIFCATESTKWSTDCIFPPTKLSEFGPCYPEGDCKQVKINDDKTGITCDADYLLQVKHHGSNAWTHIRSKELPCAGNSIVTYGMKNPLVRCRKERKCAKKDDFKADEKCPDESICKKPTIFDVTDSAKQLTCEYRAFEYKVEANHLNWGTVKTAECSDTPVGGFYKRELEDGDKFWDYSPLVRCENHKCTECKDPCPSCASNLGHTYSPPTKWNECTKFKCGDHSRMMIGGVDYGQTELVCSKVEAVAPTTALWNRNVKTTNNVICERLCIPASPLNLACEHGEAHCEKVTLNNHEEIKCTDNKKMIYYSTDSIKWNLLSSMKCDKGDGEWKDNAIAVPINSRLQCHDGCNIDQYYTETDCESDSECHKPIEPKNCKAHFGLQVQTKSSSIWIDAWSFSCAENNRLSVTIEQNAIEEKFPHKIRCIRKIGDCDRHLPSCVDEDKECRPYALKDNKFHCDDPFAFWSQEDNSSKWIKMEGVVELECRDGQILANGIPQSTEFQATCRPKPNILNGKDNSAKASHKKNDNKLVLYIAIAVICLILMVIIIATVILRVTGRGWIHRIIIDKARGNKRSGSKRSKTFTASSKASGKTASSKASSKASGKTPSKNSPKTKTSRKSTKKTQRKVEKKIASVKGKKHSPAKETVIVI